MMLQEVILKNPPRGALRPGHPWIYKSQIAGVNGAPRDGDLVKLFSAGRKFLGIGYYNGLSEITVRLLSRGPAVIDEKFFKEKINAASLHRKRFVRDTNACRLVSSEADDLPGLIVDNYDGILVLQLLTAGMDRMREVILAALKETIPHKGIYEKSESASRKIEGLEERVGWIEQARTDQVEIVEKNIRYQIQFGQGHKTGFYLDQRENRVALAEMGYSGQALDVFCYEGGFGLHLAASGMSVTGIDSQKDVIAGAQANRRLNVISDQSLQFTTANAFDELRRLEKEKAGYDLVILDPPSFVKKKSALDGALAGYKELLLRSMRILNEGGGLAVFSCSYHVNEDLLMQAAMGAAWDSHKKLTLIKFFKQSSDHPINPFIPETYYLKGFLFSVNCI